MFLIQKYTQYKAAQAEQQKRKVTEKELAQLNHKIDKLLSKLDEHEPEIADNQDDECVVCVNAKATMQTYPCGHRVVCRKCFVKTIQMAVAQRLLPLRCVLCRAKILRLKHASGAPLTSSASQYTIGSQWYHVPQSASLYSVTSSTSGVSGVSGVSSASSCSSASSYKTCASSFSSTSLKKRSYCKQGYQPLRTSSPSPSRSPQNRSGISTTNKKDKQKVASVEMPPPPNQITNNIQPAKGKVSLIQEFQREFRNGKTKTANERKLSGGSQRGGSTRIKCARLLVNQAQLCNANNLNLDTTGKVTLESGFANKNETRREFGKSSSSVLGTGTSLGTTTCKGNANIGFRKSTPPPSSQSCHSFRLSRHDSVACSTLASFKKGKHESLQAIDESDAKVERPIISVSNNETTKLDKVNGNDVNSSSSLALTIPISQTQIATKLCNKK